MIGQKRIISVKIISLCIIFILLSCQAKAQGSIQKRIDFDVEMTGISWEIRCYNIDAKAGNWVSIEVRNAAKIKVSELEKKEKALGQQFREFINTETYKKDRELLGIPPFFSNKSECEKYKSDLTRERDSKTKRRIEIDKIRLSGETRKEKYSLSKLGMVKDGHRLFLEESNLSIRISVCDCDNVVTTNEITNFNNPNLEAEFLAEIEKINSDINKINILAQNRQIIESFSKSQDLCDNLRRLQGQHYFSSTLKKIRKENPSFSFSINPLAEQVSSEYWNNLRIRTNRAYRNATDAYVGCVWNEGIQSYTANVEIPFRFVKATYDLVTNVKSLFDVKLWGSIDAVRNSYGYQDNAVQLFKVASEEALNAGEDVKDWKSYIGVAGGFLSAFNGYKQTFDLVNENTAQNGLIITNRQTAEELMIRSKNMLEQFDRYRAYIDSHSSSIDCLNDRIMRLDMDNKSIKGDKITIWGTGNFDWDGEEFMVIIKESGEDLKNEYIYCEDFIKTLQIAVNLANTDYYTIEEKVRSSGADQTQINAQLSYNQENGEWFEDESTRLSEYYVQFCENENNSYPDDVIIVSNQVVPGVEDQDVDPDASPVWEYDTEPQHDYYEEPVFNDPIDHEPDYNPHGTGGSGNRIISSGAGWSAQSTTSNQNDLQNDITAAINSGKTPTGIYVGNNGEVVVYYIDDNPLGMTSWNLEWYTDVESLQNGINSNLEQGYFPMGISFTDQGKLYVLYIMSQLQATAWQLVESELDLGSVSNDVQPYIHEKYIPVGITVFGGMYYTLLAQVHDSEPVNWTIEGYENNNYTIQQGVNSAVSSGFVPFGYLKEEGVVNLLYIGF